MNPEWVTYWQQKMKEAQRRARKLEDAGYPELADTYREEAEIIRARFLADAVIVPELTELENRYLHGDR